MMEQWFRFYSEAAKDAKLKRVARTCGRPFGEVLGVWAIVLCVASESPERGTLLLGTDLPATTDDISGEYGSDVSDVVDAMLTPQIGLLAQDGEYIYIVHWNKRQYISDSSTERTRDYRNRKQTSEQPQAPLLIGTGDNSETSQKRSENVTVTPPDTDTETDTSANALAAGKKRKPGRPAKPRDPLLDHPAVIAYREVIKLTPNELQRQAMAEVKDIDCWRKVLCEWTMHGWRPGNVQSQLEMYRGRASPNSNGSLPSRPDPPAQQRLREVRRQTGMGVSEA